MTPRRRWSVRPLVVPIALVGLVAAAAPPPAAAATLAVEYRERPLDDPDAAKAGIYSEFIPELRLRGDTTRAEDLVVEQGLVTSRALPIVAGNGCQQRSELVAACPGQGAPLVLLGDGADRLQADLPVVVDGGGGDDLITGSPGDDVITGGAGHDVLDGGLGRDRVSWADAAGPVRADLALAGAPAGPVADPDVVSGFEDADGGAAGNVLLGTPGPNRLTGGRGADVLDGRGGDDRLLGAPPLTVVLAEIDRLTGGAGDDGLRGNGRLDGGPGADRIDGRGVIRAGAGDDLVNVGGRAARVRCGVGTDAVAVYGQTVPPDCERVADLLFLVSDNLPAAEAFAAVPARPSVRGSVVTLQIPADWCPDRAPCRLPVEISRPGAGILGDATVRVGRGRPTTVRVPLTRPVCRPGLLQIEIGSLGATFHSWRAFVRPRPAAACR